MVDLLVSEGKEAEENGGDESCARYCTPVEERDDLEREEEEVSIHREPQVGGVGEGQWSFRSIGRIGTSAKKSQDIISSGIRTNSLKLVPQ